MRIADLDTETKAVLVFAQAVDRKPNRVNRERLRKALAAWKRKHERERTENLLRALEVEPPPSGKGER